MTLLEGLEKYMQTTMEGRELTRYIQENYGYYFRKIIVNSFDDVQLAEFSGEHLLKGIRKARRKYDKETMKRVIRILNGGLNYLKKDGAVSVNFLKVYQRELEEIIEQSTLSAEERERIVEMIPFLHNPNLFGFVIYSGIRQDLARALNKNSVLMSEGVCYADSFIKEIDLQGNPVFQKVTKGITRYKLSDKAKGYLVEEEREQAMYKRRAGELWKNPWELVFTTAFGDPISKAIIKEDNKLLRKLTGIPDITLERLGKMSFDFNQGEM